MPGFFGASLSPGSFRDEFAQLCEKYRVEYRVSADIGQITNFFDYIEDCEKDRASKRLYSYPKGKFASQNSGGHQRLILGRDPKKSNGTESFDAQNTVEEANTNVNCSIIKPEPPALNAADILMETTPGEGGSVTISSENPGFDAIAKMEEQETSLLFQQNVSRPLQPIYSLLSDGCEAQVKEEVDDDDRQYSGAVKGLVKEEPLGEEFDKFEDVGIHGGENNSEETRQESLLALRGSVPLDTGAPFNCLSCLSRRLS